MSGPPTDAERHASSWAIAALVAASLAWRWVLTERMVLIMDEFADTQLAWQVGNGARIYGELPWERTPLMTYIVGAVVAGFDDSMGAVLAARKVAWACTVVIFVLTWLCARAVVGRRHAAWAPLQLAAFSTFLDHSIRVRADVFSTLFATPALLALLRSRIAPVELGAAGVGLGLAFLASQKAIYFVAAFALGLAARVFAEQGLRARSCLAIARHGLVAGVGFAVPVGTLLLVMASTGRLDAFLDQCFFYAARIGFVAETYAYTTSYLGQSFRRDPFFWALGITGALVVLREVLASRFAPVPGRIEADAIGPKAALAGWTCVVLALVLHHTIKFPYIFVTVSPCLAVCATVAVARILDAPPAKGPIGAAARVVLSAFALTCFVALPLFHHRRNMDGALLAVQSSVVRRVDAITTPADYVFDGIGMAVTRKHAVPYILTARWFDERAAGADYPILPSLERNQPKVLIRTYRLARLRPQERAYLDQTFVEDGPHVHVVGARFLGASRGIVRGTVHLLASARYAVIAPRLGDVRLDGRAPRATEALAAGVHEIALHGAPQDVLFKYAPAVMRPAPPMLDLALFPSDIYAR